MSDKKFEMSRRNALIGLGTVGAASAGAGLGTSAYFSDEEAFEGNSLTAGELDLFVESHFSADQGSYDGMLASSETEVINGSYDGEHDPAEISYELDDVKPGDSGKLKFCFSIVDNPAYLWACGMATSETAGNGGGHLADHLTATLRYFNKKDETPGDIIMEGSFREALLALRNGVPLDSNGDASVSISDRMEYDGSEASDDYQEQALCIEWEFPIRSTQADPDMDNNDAQAASMEFDLKFYAEQSRHNDGLNNPCVDESYAADYINPDGINYPIPDGVARVGVSYGDDLVVYGITFDEPAGSEYSLADPDFADANFSMPFDGDDSGNYDFQVAWNAEGNDEFRYSEVNSTPNWEKDVGPWSSVPSAITAFKSGKQAIITVPRANLEASSNDYVFGFSASAGGEEPSVGIPVDGPWSGDDNFTSSENGQSTTLQ